MANISSSHTVDEIYDHYLELSPYKKKEDQSGASSVEELLELAAAEAQSGKEFYSEKNYHQAAKSMENAIDFTLLSRDSEAVKRIGAYFEISTMCQIRLKKETAALLDARMLIYLNDCNVYGWICLAYCYHAIGNVTSNRGMVIAADMAKQHTKELVKLVNKISAKINGESYQSAQKLCLKLRPYTPHCPQTHSLNSASAEMVNALSKGKNIIHFLNVLETKLAAVVEVMSVLENGNAYVEQITKGLPVNTTDSAAPPVVAMEIETRIAPNVEAPFEPMRPTRGSLRDRLRPFLAEFSSDDDFNAPQM